MTRRLVPFATAGLVLMGAAAGLVLHTQGAAIAVALCCAVLAGALTHARPALAAPRAPEELETLREKLRESERRETAGAEAQRAALSRIRHDVRGALSPILLVADRLAMSDDAAKKRAGDVISRAVARTAELLRDG